ncbi:hypothetical protein SAY87_023050 [Trapa incisa]|uniref:Uncharacterized protein n=1 Tax=Trapa incisa TaxID=236973 RepID=A0AAN7Q6G2_9MYRT|nr:hypothetical protein SAY87_023050 [Trapa incisa]
MGSQLRITSSAYVVFMVSLVLSISCFERTLALRPLGIFESLRRGPVPPSRSSPCTYIPGGKGRGRCVLSEMNYAGSSSIHGRIRSDLSSARSLRAS